MEPTSPQSPCTAPTASAGAGWSSQCFALAALLFLAALTGLSGCDSGGGAIREASAATVGGSTTAAVAAARFELPAPGSYELPAIQGAADGAVLDTRGRTHRLAEYLGGDYVLLSFIYTRCYMAKGCPFATRVFQQVQRRLAADPQVAGRVRLVTLSFDPDADTPQVMREYAADAGVEAGSPAGDASEREAWSFLTTASRADLQPILDGYGQFLVREVDARGRYTGGISHVLKVFLIDPEGQVRNIYSSDFLRPELVITDVKTLMMEEGGA